MLYLFTKKRRIDVPKMQKAVTMKDGDIKDLESDDGEEESAF